MAGITCRHLIYVGAWNREDCCDECHDAARAGFDMNPFFNEDGDVVGDVCCNAEAGCVPTEEQWVKLNRIINESEDE